MESYNGNWFYSSKADDGANVVMTYSHQTRGDLTFTSGDLVEVYLAPGADGANSAGRWCIASYTCP
ncbi:hypothetical protein ACPPVW_09740 [Leifsonia sp. McL0607]|uniref:hypothetical protein n=1 Tax=Leifsonia sp. McL0607 TaxID=3415672 RepID=UPI003CE87987